jgi:hypothetical protein
VLEALCMLVHRAFDVLRRNALGCELERAVLQRRRGQPMRPRVGDLREDALGDVCREHFLESRGRVVGRGLRGQTWGPKQSRDEHSGEQAIQRHREILILRECVQRCSWPSYV